MANSRGALPFGLWPIVALFLVAFSIMALSSVAARSARKPSVSSQKLRSGGSRYHFHNTEKCFMRGINDRRARNGLHRLKWDRQIGYVARRHATSMARSTSVLHDRKLGHEVTHWRALGQNTGRGWRCDSLLEAFWRSSGHRHNILGKWSWMGVGARWRDDRLYVQQVFEYRSNPGNIYRYP